MSLASVFCRLCSSLNNILYMGTVTIWVRSGILRMHSLHIAQKAGTHSKAVCASLSIIWVCGTYCTSLLLNILKRQVPACWEKTEQFLSVYLVVIIWIRSAFPSVLFIRTRVKSEAQSCGKTGTSSSLRKALHLGRASPAHSAQRG